MLATPPADGARPATIVGGVAAGALAAVGGAAFAIVVLRRAQRRRRLTDGSPAQRIAGAWRELTDALRLAGHAVPPHLAATEVAAFAATAMQAGGAASEARSADARAGSTEGQPGPSQESTGPSQGRMGPTSADWPAAPLRPLDALVESVNTSAFAPGAADPAQAERAGAQAVAYADALRARRSWWRRAWWTVHPGPLRWRP
jgi:hypothetical protein